MKKTDQKIPTYDTIVIGGGPAGMMSAGRLAERGARILLLDKNPDVGKKLLITGGGRCNVTNAEEDIRKLLVNYKDSSKFLFSAFSQYAVRDTLSFFHNRGMNTKIEDNGRVFPVSDSARTVYEVLKNYLKVGKVKIENKAEVNKLITKDGKITGVSLTDGRLLQAHSYILATGGKSRPDTGSTGDGFIWLKKLGHRIIEPNASLVPIATREKWVSKLSGITLTSVKINIFQDNKKHFSKIGKILFTHTGVSGPTILNLSKSIGELLSYGEVKIYLDLFPTLDERMLNERLIQLFQENSNKQLKNALSLLLPSILAETVISLTNTPPETQSNSVTREIRKDLIKLLKAFPLSVKSLLGTDKAIITSGGVDLTEINFKTMQSRLYDNLYIVGDLLNIDRPSGGFSLQLCWTTGFVAGNNLPIKQNN